MTSFLSAKRAHVSWLFVMLLGLGVSLSAGQSSTATLTGTVVDATGAVLRSADVRLVNSDTALAHRTVSAADGVFTLAALPPGRYVLTVTLRQFVPVEMSDIILNVGDRVSVRVTLNMASLGETATVIAEPGRVNTSPAVGSVVSRQFVENMPLNGRSLHALLELTPGVVAAVGGSGFSVNGQRTTANYFTIDGVGANAGITNSPSQSGAGQGPSFTAVGSTAALVAVDALQEFRIETSTYAPEFGRMPGGQVSLVTRSGTNVLHGSAFDYFRHEAMDATDWFVNNLGQRKPKLRQHDFGGVVGGAILRNRTFFFGSYEGLRLLQPRVAITPVISAAARTTVAPVLQPYVSAIPLPNGSDLGAGTAAFVASWSDPSRADTTSVRIDHVLGGRVRTFTRWNQSPSYTKTRNLATVATTHRDAKSVTAGVTWVLSAHAIHESRINYTRSQAPEETQPDRFGGAIPPTLSVFEQGRTPDNTLFAFGISGAGNWSWGALTRYEQRQINIVDSLTVTSASHEVKIGIDLRRLSPVLQGNSLSQQSLSVSNVASLQTGRAASYFAQLARDVNGVAVFDTLSLYGQDTWRLAPRLSLTYGARWEVVPPPHATGEISPVTLDGFDAMLGGQVSLAPRGTPLWKTRTANVAPRIGMSYVLSERPSKELVVRGGYGIFYDLGYGPIANTFVDYPFVATKTVLSPTLPLSSEVTALSTDFDAERPSSLTTAARDLKLPYTHQWNVAAEQALGRSRTVTASYVASAGRRLLKLDNYRVAFSAWPGANRTSLNVVGNGARGDYRALQLHLRQRLHFGVQAMASYTWSRSRDTVSLDRVGGISIEQVRPELDFGNSDFDVTHNATIAATFQAPPFRGSQWSRVLLSSWAMDLLVRARTGFPVQVTTTTPFPPEATNRTVRPNVVSGQDFWLTDSAVPGGRRLNRNAFVAPPPATQGDLPRGIIRGFGAKQADFALRREFGLVKQTRLQLRFEMFNVFNTPNFGNPVGLLQSSLFGVSTMTLSQSLGGLNPTYQVGGPRSSQVALKLTF